MTLDRSPDVCFKRLNYRYLLETDHAPDVMPCGPYSSQSHNWHIVKCCLPDDATYQMSGL